MSERVTFIATGDARRGQFTVNSDIYAYRDWVYNTLAGYGLAPASLVAQYGWIGWGDMTLTFEIDLVCGVDIPQLREAFASLFDYAEILVNSSVSSGSLNCSGGGGGLIDIGNIDGGTVYGGGTQGTGGTQNQNNGGGNNQTPQTTVNSFEKQMNDLSKWLKDHQTEAMMGGLILVVLLMRK